jgi:hypothetical protein
MFVVGHHMCHRSANGDREHRDGLHCLLDPGYVVQNYKMCCMKIIEFLRKDVEMLPFSR